MFCQLLLLIYYQKLLNEYCLLCQNLLIHLHYIQESQSDLYPLKEITKRYYLSLDNLDWNLNKYLETFSKKHRKNMKRDLKIVSELNPKIVKNKMEDFELLVKLSANRFQEDSFLHEQIFIKGFKKLIEVAKKRNELPITSSLIRILRDRFFSLF